MDRCLSDAHATAKQLRNSGENSGAFWASQVIQRDLQNEDINFSVAFWFLEDVYFETYWMYLNMI